MDAGPPPAAMTTVSTHHFGDSPDMGGFDVQITESIQEEYGMFVWPCSVALAEYVWQQKHRFPGATVVEVLLVTDEVAVQQLGAGTSLPGLVAAKVGADVTLTDRSDRPEVLANITKVCELNRVECKVMGLSWGQWDEPFFDLEPKIVLGADVLYDTNDFDDLFATVTFLLQKTPGSVFITTYHNRSGHHLIEFLMVKWRLKCTKLVDVFSFMPSDKMSTLQGNIQLVEIELDQQP